MNVRSHGSRKTGSEGLTFRSVRAFFIATFVLSWGTLALYGLFQAWFDAVFGEMGYTNPVYILAVYAPGLVGVVLVWRHYGLTGLGSFFRRFTLWRMPMVWWVRSNWVSVDVPARPPASPAHRGGTSRRSGERGVRHARRDGR